MWQGWGEGVTCMCVCVKLSRAKIYIQYAYVIPGVGWHEEQDTVSIHVLCVRYLMKRDLIEPNGLQCPIRFFPDMPLFLSKRYPSVSFLPKEHEGLSFPEPPG